MNILIVADQLLEMKNGNPFGAKSFTNNVRRLAVIGDVSICCIEKKNQSVKQEYNDDISDCIPTERVHFVAKSFIWPTGSTRRTLEKAISEADLVIGYLPALNAEAAMVMARRKGKKTLGIMVACPWDALWNQDIKRKIAAPYRRLLNRYVFRNADYAIYVTEKFLQSRYPTRGESLALSDTVLPVTDSEVLARRLDKIRTHKEGEPFKITTIGGLEVAFKGQKFVIQALAELKKRGFSDYVYYPIGAGKPDLLIEEARRLGVESQLHFPGVLDHSAIFPMLDDMDIYVHPSLVEGLPRSIVEAMSRALPVIGSNTGGIPELLLPDAVVDKGSPSAIAEKLIQLRSIETMAANAMRNFEESRKFNCRSLDERRNLFFRKIKSDLLLNK